jgi:adenylate cyclase
MTSRLSVRVYEDQNLQYTDEFEGAILLGRQDRAEPAPFRRIRADRGWRLVIAPWAENDVGRRHALVEPLPGGKVRVSNRSSGQVIHLPSGQLLQAGDSCELALPAVFALGKGRLAVRLQEVAQGLLNSLPNATLAPRVDRIPSVRFPASVDPEGSINSREVLQWLSSTLDVLQAGIDEPTLVERAAEAAIEMIDLDLAQVLRLVDDEWHEQVSRQAPGAERQEIRPASRRVLAHVRQEKRTFWEQLPADQASPHSLAGVDAVVAAPLLDFRGEVLGALYGERRRGASLGAISEVEATLVELLARGVAAGLARLEQEKATLAERVRFEQFFTPDLARQLAQNPNLLEAREAEVSVLFCDIRGFSRISERLGAARTVAWCRDVLDMLSRCILAESGVLVDYIGDGLMAMWGAPGEQPDHARRACRAALAMLAGVGPLSDRWHSTVGEPLALGIGINTGEAQVGNTGSQVKFKYGPRGTTVNLGSRVEGVTKHLKCSVLITKATHDELGDSFTARRLARVQVVNIAEPVDLFELAPQDRPHWAEARTEYARALGLFEARQFDPAAATLTDWYGRRPEDGPALVLLHRAVRCLVDGAPATHPVWVLKDK